MDVRSAYDPTLFEGTAAYYARYRPPYPAGLFEHLVACFQLDGTGRALDLGCGTGLLGFPIAKHVGQVVCMDPDAQMLAEARRAAASTDLTNLQFVLGSSWDVTPSLGAFRLALLGESLHWMDRDAILHALYDLVTPGGGLAIVSRQLLAPEAFQTCVGNVLKRFLGEKRRAGQGYYTEPPERHEVVLARSAWRPLAPFRYEHDLEWTVEQCIGNLHSTSYAARRLFGDRAQEFDDELSLRLLDLEPSGVFRFRLGVEALLGTKLP